MNGRSFFSTSSGDNKDDGKKASTAVSKGTQDQQVADIKILRTLAGYLWMKDNPEFRLRVITALGFLVGAKVSFSNFGYFIPFCLNYSLFLLGLKCAISNGGY